MSSSNTFNPDHIFDCLHRSAFLHDCGLISMIRKTLDVNPYKTKKYKHTKSMMWKEQAIINFPILYLASIYLYIYAKQRGVETFLFVTRDCCHWHKIFKGLFPDCNVHYFHCSRNMLDKAMAQINHPYDDYVRTIIGTDPSKAIYIDIYGRCKRTYNYFEQKFGKGPCAFLLSTRLRNYSRFPKIVKKYKNKDKFIILVFKGKGSYVESLNLDLIGTLQDYTTEGPIRDKLEYEKRRIKPYHKCMKYIYDEISPIKTKLKIKKASRLLTELMINIKNIFQFVANREPAILKHIKFIRTHPVKSIDTTKSITTSNVSNQINQTIQTNQTTNNNPDSIINDSKSVETCQINKGTLKVNVIKGIDCLDFNKIKFDKLLSNNTLHCLMWSGSYDGKECAIKMILFKDGLYYLPDKKKYMDGFNNRKVKSSVAKKYFVDGEIPFLHTQFQECKAMSLQSFKNETENLSYLNKYKMTPKLYGYTIIQKGPFKYGFIIMDKVDCSVKQVLLNRSLTEEEEKNISKLIYKLHSNNITHGDLKPSNIGVYLNSKGIINKCMFLDCPRVKQWENCDKQDLQRKIDNEMKYYKKHIKKNIDERVNNNIN